MLKSARTPDEIRSLVETVVPSAAVAEQIERAIAAIAEGGKLAVRSSALGEDSVAHSFAGQLESFLFIAPERVSEYISRVWRSGFGERLMAYRKQSGLPLLPRCPAVIVQRVIEGEVSGVAFSADPVSGRRGIAVVAAVPGLASSLVSGATNGDTWRVDRQGVIVERNIAVKQVAQRHDPAAIDGIATIALSGEDATRPVLEEQRVLEVAALARRTEKFFGRPQDIEWTWEKGRLFLLQSRPITGLGQKSIPTVSERFGTIQTSRRATAG